MNVQWSRQALHDLDRLHAFLALVAPQAAVKAVRMIVDGVGQLPRHPRIGLRLQTYRDRDVRRHIIADYEIRYEIQGGEILIVRIFHVREARP